MSGTLATAAIAIVIASDSTNPLKPSRFTKWSAITAVPSKASDLRAVVAGSFDQSVDNPTSSKMGTSGSDARTCLSTVFRSTTTPANAMRYATLHTASAGSHTCEKSMPSGGLKPSGNKTNAITWRRSSRRVGRRVAPVSSWVRALRGCLAGSAKRAPDRAQLRREKNTIRHHIDRLVVRIPRASGGP